MNPGRLDRRITIQQVTETRATGGGVIQTWADFASVWANKVEYDGSEQVAGDRRESENTVVWTVRYNRFYTTKMRIVDDRSDTYNIVGVSEVTRKKLMKLTTKINK